MNYVFVCDIHCYMYANQADLPRLKLAWYILTSQLHSGFK